MYNYYELSLSDVTKVCEYSARLRTKLRMTRMRQDTLVTSGNLV